MHVITHDECDRVVEIFVREVSIFFLFFSNGEVSIILGSGQRECNYKIIGLLWLHDLEGKENNW